MNTQFRKVKGISWQEFGSGMIALNPQSEKIHELNSVGMFIFENIDGKQSTEDIHQKICQNFNVDEETAKNDLEEFLAQAQEWEIIEQ